jgi:hypothetical protein
MMMDPKLVDEKWLLEFCEVFGVLNLDYSIIHMNSKKWQK